MSTWCPALVQVWLSAIPMDSTPVVDATPSVLRSVEHCKSLVIAGDSAALTYAEANLPSFFPGEKGCAPDILYWSTSHHDLLCYVILCCSTSKHVLYITLFALYKFILHCISKWLVSSIMSLREHKETKIHACGTGNCKLALDHDFYPSQRKSKNLLCKLGNSLINMPRGLQHAMKALLIHPPQSVLFLNLQVLHKIWLDQTLSTVLKHCPQIRELHHVSTQPEQCCAWADLQCCHTLQQLDQVSL